MKEKEGEGGREGEGEREMGTGRHILVGVCLLNNWKRKIVCVCVCVCECVCVSVFACTRERVSISQ